MKWNKMSDQCGSEKDRRSAKSERSEKKHCDRAEKSDRAEDRARHTGSREGCGTRLALIFEKTRRLQQAFFGEFHWKAGKSLLLYTLFYI